MYGWELLPFSPSQEVTIPAQNNNMIKIFSNTHIASENPWYKANCMAIKEVALAIH